MASGIPFTFNPSLFVDNFQNYYNPNLAERQQYKQTVFYGPGPYGFIQFDSIPKQQMPHVVNLYNKILFQDIPFQSVQPFTLTQPAVSLIRDQRNETYYPQMNTYQTMSSPDTFEMKTSGVLTFHGSHNLKDLILPSSDSTDIEQTDNKLPKNKEASDAKFPTRAIKLDEKIFLPEDKHTKQENFESDVQSLKNSYSSLHAKADSENKALLDDELNEKFVQGANTLSGSKQSIDRDMPTLRSKQQNTSSNVFDIEKKRNYRSTRQEQPVKKITTEKHKSSKNVGNKGELPNRFRVHNRPLYEKYQEAFKESVKNGDYWKKRAKRYIKLPDSAKTQIFPHKDDISLRLNVGLYPQFRYPINKSNPFPTYRRMRAHTLPANYQNMACYLPEFNNFFPQLNNHYIAELQRKLRELKFEMKNMKRAMSEARNHTVPASYSPSKVIKSEKGQIYSERENDRRVIYDGIDINRRSTSTRRKHKKQHSNNHKPDHKVKALTFMPAMNNFECTYAPTSHGYYFVKADDSLNSVESDYYNLSNPVQTNSKFETAVADQFKYASDSDLNGRANDSSSSSVEIKDPETEKILKEFSKWYFKRHQKSFGENAGRVRFKYYSAKKKAENDDKLLQEMHRRENEETFLQKREDL